jgi:hypothetical protein
MHYGFVPGKTVRRRRKARFHEDRVNEEFVSLFIALINESRRANGESDVYPGALAFGNVSGRFCDQPANVLRRSARPQER